MKSDLFTVFFTALILAGCLYVYREGRNNDLTWVRSKLDGEMYLVRNLPDKQEASDMLAHLKQKLIVMKNHLIEKYPGERPIQQLQSNFNPNSISETSSDEKHTSYTVNKGEKVLLCLRTKDKSHKIEQENTLVFVALHEMAHIMTKSIGHDKDDFWQNFKFLLQNAKDIGIYENIDYREQPEQYCGMTITDNPYYDKSIKVDVKNQ